MATMKAAQFKVQNGDLEIVHVPIPNPGKGEVRIKVYACGVCRGDEISQTGGMGNTWPRIPGHEVAGVIDEIGEDVINFQKGEFVGVGWFGGSCGTCNQCRGNRPGSCASSKVCGAHVDGGFAEYLVIKWNAVVRLPSGLKPEEAGPLLCAGLTTFNSLRNCGALGGELVVIHGLGGLGHLGIQYARKLGYHTVAVSRGKQKEELAKQLGAHIYIDTQSQDAVKEIQALGGARIILETSPEGSDLEAILPALGLDGKLILVGAIHGPVKVNTLPMLMRRQTLMAWPSGGPLESEATAKFSKLQDIKPVVEVFPLDKAKEAYKHMVDGKGKFRVVLSIAQP